MDIGHFGNGSCVCCRESRRLRPRSLACSFPLGGRKATLHPGTHTPNRSGLESDWPWVRCRSLGHARGSSAEIAVDMNGIARQCLGSRDGWRTAQTNGFLVPGSSSPQAPGPPVSSRPSRPAPRPLPGGVWSMPSWRWGVYTRAACRPSWRRSYPTLRLASSPLRPLFPPNLICSHPSPIPPSLQRYLRSTRPKHRRDQRCLLPPPSPRTTPPAVHMPGLTPRP